MSIAGGAGVTPRLADIKRSQPTRNNRVRPLKAQNAQNASLRMSTLDSLECGRCAVTELRHPQLDLYDMHFILQ